jgi:hypothetical protein
MVNHLEGKDMRRVLGTVMLAAATVGLVSVAAGPASAETVNCQTYTANTGSGLEATTDLVICHNKNYITQLHAKHDNYGDHAHTGYLRIADNKGHAWQSAKTTVPPGTTATAKWTLNENSDNTRYCAVWVKPDGTFTAGYACKVFNG